MRKRKLNDWVLIYMTSIVKNNCQQKRAKPLNGIMADK